MGQEKANSSMYVPARVSALAEYTPRLHRYLQRCVRNEADVKDLMQEIALGFMKVPRETVIEDPAKYLFTIAIHVMTRHFLKKDASLVTYDSEAADRLLDGVEESGMCDAESKAIQQDLLRLIQRLPQAHYEILRLNMETDLSYREIAERLRMSEDTVKKYLYTAKAALRRGES